MNFFFLSHGCSQNYGPFLVIVYSTASTIWWYKNRTLILQVAIRDNYWNLPSCFVTGPHDPWINIVNCTSNGFRNAIDNYVGSVTSDAEALSGRSHFISLQGARWYLY